MQKCLLSKKLTRNQKKTHHSFQESEMCLLKSLYKNQKYIQISPGIRNTCKKSKETEIYAKVSRDQKYVIKKKIRQSEIEIRSANKKFMESELRTKVSIFHKWFLKKFPGIRNAYEKGSRSKKYI